MKCYECKMHYLRLSLGSSQEEQVVAALNGFGQEGWCVNHIMRCEAHNQPFSWGGALNLLLEREALE